MSRGGRRNGWSGRGVACLLMAWAIGALAGGCAAPGDGETGPDLGPFEVSVVASGAALEVRQGTRVLQRLRAVELRRFVPQVKSALGFFDFARGEVQSPRVGSVWAAAGDGFSARTGDGQEVATVAVQRVKSALRLKVTAAADQAGAAIALRFERAAQDRFWGFGEQYNHIDFAGMTVAAWTQEQGVGRVDQDKPPLPRGSYKHTYFAMPWFFDPQRGHGVLVEGSSYCAFDLGAADPERWEVEVWRGAEVSMLVLPGPTGLTVIEQLTEQVGRLAAMPPSWALSGVWLAAQGGREAVDARVDKALAAGVPVTAVWVQDWVGVREFVSGSFGVNYRWAVDETRYPDLGAQITALAARGVRFLGYFNPFVLPKNEHYAPGAEKGWLIKKNATDPYDFLIVTFAGSMLDVTHPEAGAWFQGFARAATDLGMKGWMADFGEWLPWDAVLAQGQAPEVHNLYPTAWHRLNREVLQEAWGDDFVLLTRSGWTGEQAVAQVVWAGDQEADWAPGDGMPTVVKALLTLGMAGVPLSTHDIAGFSGGPSGQELFQRWVEMGAFSPVMRTHDGLKKLDNHRFDKDAQTLAHFKRMALVHQALLPLLTGLTEQAMAKGWPLVRHTALVDPQWAAAYDAHGQWMLGDDLVFAPVVTAGATQVQVALPQGQWVHLFTGETVEGRQVRQVQAPVGTPCVWVRQGRLAAVVQAVKAVVAP